MTIRSIKPSVTLAPACNLEHANRQPISGSTATTRSKTANAIREALPSFAPTRAAAPRAATAAVTYEVTPKLLEDIIASRRSPVGKGKPVEGIPYTNPDPEKRSITVMNARTGQLVCVGDMNHRFSQQSMSKPTAMALAMKLMGGDDSRYRQFVGVEASGRPYNAHDLLPDGRPFNSSVNMGALATWVLIMAHTPQGEDPFKLFLNEMKSMTNNPNLDFNEKMAHGQFAHRPEGEKSGNQKLLDVLDDTGFMKVLEDANGPLPAEQKEKMVSDAF
ncbi:MAG: glutaminase, partial [Paraburkholderia sp.]|nr:glutaminase [Paraburkholderia sp.]